MQTQDTLSRTGFLVVASQREKLASSWRRIVKQRNSLGKKQHKNPRQYGRNKMWPCSRQKVYIYNPIERKALRMCVHCTRNLVAALVALSCYCPRRNREAVTNDSYSFIQTRVFNSCMSVIIIMTVSIDSIQIDTVRKANYPLRPCSKS